MKKFAVLMLVLFLAGCNGNIGSGPAEPVDFGPVEFVPYEVEEMGVRFEYPEGWVYEDGEMRDGYFAMHLSPPGYETSREYLPFIRIQFGLMPIGYTIEDFPGYNEVMNTKYVMGNKVLRGEQIMIGGEPARLIVYEQGKIRKAFEISMIKERKGDYSIQSYMSFQYYPGEEGLIDILMRIADSFEIIPDEEREPIVHTMDSCRDLRNDLRCKNVTYSNNQISITLENTGYFYFKDMKVSIRECPGYDSIDGWFPVKTNHTFNIECKLPRDVKLIKPMLAFFNFTSGNEFVRRTLSIDFDAPINLGD